MKFRALVVDHSAVTRRMVVAVLQRAAIAEFEFIEASNGVEALRRVRTESPDIMFCDWKLPKMSGFELVKSIRADNERRRIPIIIVSGERTIGKIEDALNRAGATSYLTKPVSVEDVKRRVGPILCRLSAEAA